MQITIQLKADINIAVEAQSKPNMKKIGLRPFCTQIFVDPHSGQGAPSSRPAFK